MRNVTRRRKTWEPCRDWFDRAIDVFQWAIFVGGILATLYGAALILRGMLGYGA